MSVADQFGDNLARVRRGAGMSQDEVARRAEVHRTEVSHIERGLRVPRIDTLLKLAGALEVEPGDLLDRMAWKAAEPVYGHFEFPDQDATL